MEETTVGVTLSWWDDLDEDGVTRFIMLGIDNGADDEGEADILLESESALALADVLYSMADELGGDND